jgi:hypothetical protein
VPALEVDEYAIVFFYVDIVVLIAMRLMMMMMMMMMMMHVGGMNDHNNFGHIPIPTECGFNKGPCHWGVAPLSNIHFSVRNADAWE